MGVIRHALRPGCLAAHCLLTVGLHLRLVFQMLDVASGASACALCGDGGGSSWCPCPSRGSCGAAGRADWRSCRGPGTLPRDGASALCVLSILSAPCPCVTKGLLRVRANSVPSQPQAPGPPDPRPVPCTHPCLPKSTPSRGWSARSCFLSLKPSRDNGPDSPLSPARSPPQPCLHTTQGIPGGPLGSAQARGPGPGGRLLPHGLRPPPLQGKMVLPSTGWAFQCWGPQAPADCTCHSDKPPRTLKLPSSALLTGKLFKNVLTIQ